MEVEDPGGIEEELTEIATAEPMPDVEEAARVPNVEITHAGTARRGGDIVTAGGRVLNVTALGASPAEARDRAYEAANMISFDGMQMRTDIAERAAAGVASP